MYIGTHWQEGDWYISFLIPQILARYIYVTRMLLSWRLRAVHGLGMNIKLNMVCLSNRSILHIFCLFSRWCTNWLTRSQEIKSNNMCLSLVEKIHLFTNITRTYSWVGNLKSRCWSSCLPWHGKKMKRKRLHFSIVDNNNKNNINIINHWYIHTISKQRNDHNEQHGA